MTSCIRSEARAAAAALLLALPAAAHAQKGDDAVLRALIEGTQALAAHDTAVASRRFDAATSAIAGIWGGTPEAAQARRLWYAESVKPFRGEAYERMMAFYYRGLLYLTSGDFGNAQAAFRLAVQQDAFAEEEQHRSDVVAPLYLLGVALQAQGSAAAADEAFAALRGRRPDLPAFDGSAPPPRVLVVVETGAAPRKVPDGINADRMRLFRGRSFTERQVLVRVDSAASVPVWAMEDVYWQAASRGGRPIDFVLRGKARFADASTSTGSGFADLGSAVATEALVRQQTAQLNGQAPTRLNVTLRTSGDVMEGVGAAAQLVGALVNPSADVRYWDNLPDAVHLLPLDLPAGEHRLAFSFATREGAEIPELAQDITVRVDAAASRPTIVWLTSRPRASAYLSRARR